MNCDELQPDYLPYAFGTLTDPELTELRAHLDRGCANCTAGVRDAGSIAFTLGATVDGPEPPRRLRSRILAAAGESTSEERVPSRPWWASPWISAGAAALLTLAIAAGWYGSRARISQEEVARLRSELDGTRAQTAAMREAFALIEAPETRAVTFGDGKRPAPPRGRVFVHPSGVLLIASNLAAPPAGKTFEMWVIRGGKPAPAGLFDADAQGNAIHLFRTAAAPNDVVAVTIEPSGGVSAPTSTPIIVAPL